MIPSRKEATPCLALPALVRIFMLRNTWYTHKRYTQWLSCMYRCCTFDSEYSSSAGGIVASYDPLAAVSPWVYVWYDVIRVLLSSDTLSDGNVELWL